MAYIYRHIRLDTNTPFYIGVGSDINYSRAKSNKSRNKHWINIRNITDIKIDILVDGLDWQDACKKEQEFIKLYGRSDLKLGTLCNLTDGGEGFIGLVMSDERKENISKNHAKFWLGKKRPELSEMTIRMNKARVWSDDSKSKMKKSKSGNKSQLFGKFGKDHHTSKAILCITTGIIYESVSDASKKLNLNIGHIASVARGLLSATGHKKYPGGLQFKYLTT